MAASKPRRVLLREHLADNPEIRFEQLDPTPMEEAVIPPRPLRMSDLVAQYVQASQSPEPPQDEADFSDVDDQDRVLTEYQVYGMALEAEEFERLHGEEPSSPAKPIAEENSPMSEPAQQAPAPEEPPAQSQSS